MISGKAAAVIFVIVLASFTSAAFFNNNIFGKSSFILTYDDFKESCPDALRSDSSLLLSVTFSNVDAVETPRDKNGRGGLRWSHSANGDIRFNCAAKKGKSVAFPKSLRELLIFEDTAKMRCADSGNTKTCTLLLYNLKGKWSAVGFVFETKTSEGLQVFTAEEFPFINALLGVPNGLFGSKPIIPEEIRFKISTKPSPTLDYFEVFPPENGGGNLLLDSWVAPNKGVRMQLFQKNYERYSAPFVVMYAHQKGTLIRAARLYPTAKSKFKHEFVVTGKYASSISSSVLQQLNEVTPFFARLSFKCHSKSGPARSIFSLPPKVTEKEKQDLRALYARLKREGKPVQETPADIDIDVELMQYYDGHLAGAYVLKETALGSGEREKLTTRLPKEEKEKTIIKKFVIRQTAPLVELGSAEYDCVFINKNAKNEKGKVAMELLLPQAVSGRKSTARVA